MAKYVVVNKTENQYFREREWGDSPRPDFRSIIDSYFVKNLVYATEYEKEEAKAICERLQYVFKTLKFDIKEMHY